MYSNNNKTFRGGDFNSVTLSVCVTHIRVTCEFSFLRVAVSRFFGMIRP